MIKQEFWDNVINKIGVELYKKRNAEMIDDKISFQKELAMTGKVKNYTIKKPSQPMRRQ